MPANLNRKQQREIKAVVERAKKDNGIPQTAQQSIPFQRMFPDGICRVTDSYYTKTIQFQDINYQLAQQEDKTAIFDEWCSFLNFFDSSIHFELSFMNLSTDAESFEKSIRIPFKKDTPGRRLPQAAQQKSERKADAQVLHLPPGKHLTHKKTDPSSGNDIQRMGL